MKQVGWVLSKDDAHIARIATSTMVTGLARREGNGWFLSEAFVEKIRKAGSTDERPGFIVSRVGEAVLLEAFSWTESKVAPPPLPPAVVDVSTVTEYGLQQRLSTPIRCF